MTKFSEMFARDLASCYREIGVTVAYNGRFTCGVLMHEPLDALQLGGKQVAVQETTLTLCIPFGSLGELKNNEHLAADGKTYQITKFITLGNSNEQKLWLMAV